jgi:hypothetical protein
MDLTGGLDHEQQQTTDSCPPQGQSHAPAALAEAPHASLKARGGGLPMNAVRLLPAMTLQQMAVWCAIHGREIRVAWRLKGEELIPVVDTFPQESSAQYDDVRFATAWWNSLSEHQRITYRGGGMGLMAAWHHYLEEAVGL